MFDFQSLIPQYQQALLRQLVPFWLQHGRDVRWGGYFDILTPTGEAIDADKSVMMQAQQAWIFARLYNTLDGQARWLEHARHGADFLSKFAHDDQLTCYDRIDRIGQPVVESTSSLPDCFTTMAYAQIYRATGEDEWAMLAKQTLSNLLHRQADRTPWEPGQQPTTPPYRYLNEPVAVLDTLLETQFLLDDEQWKEAVEQVLQEILHEFVERRTDTLRACVLPDGSFVNTPEGRRLDVGLTFRTANLLLKLFAGSLTKKETYPALVNRKLATQVTDWCLTLCEQAWDKQTAGLRSAVDLKGQPLVEVGEQHKWAWVQVEALSALLSGYLYTQQPACLTWFKRVHDFTFSHFPDPQQPGWHLAIDAHAQPILTVRSIPTVGGSLLMRSLSDTMTLLGRCETLPTNTAGTRGQVLQSRLRESARKLPD